MARPPILSVALPTDTGRVLSIQSHTVQVRHLLCHASPIHMLVAFLLAHLSHWWYLDFFTLCL
jgi:hypothetical protein